jgi:aminoglycoside phosphotransferase (APT) family kinase protein
VSELLDQPSPVREGETLDLHALATWLRNNTELLDEHGELSVQQFPSGYSNLTYMLAAGERELVLRRPPFGNTVATGHDMSREFRVLGALAPVYPLAPRPLAFCDDGSVLGVPFYLMERRRGTIIRRRPPKGMVIDREQARALSTSLIDGLADLHAIDWRAVGLGDLGKPEGYARRQVEGWTRRWQASKTKELPGMDSLATWLAAELPADADEGPTLIHNDYKYDNVVLDPEQPTRITAVLDWEMATIGSPAMDLGTTLGYWVDADDDARLQGFAFGPTNLPGSLTRRALVERYVERSGRAIARPVYWRVFGMFKIAVIIQQIFARYQRGSTQDPRFAALGYFVELLAEVGGEAAGSGRL